MSDFKRIKVDLNVPGQWMPRWKVLGLHHGSTPWAVELDEPDPIRVKREVEVLVCANHRMHLLGVPICYQTTLFVGAIRRPKIGPAPVAYPSSRWQFDIEIFCDADPHLEHLRPASPRPEAKAAPTEQGVRRHTTCEAAAMSLFAGIQHPPIFISPSRQQDRCPLTSLSKMPPYFPTCIDRLAVKSLPQNPLDPDKAC